VAGRYRQSGRTTIRITGKVGDERRSHEFPADLAGSYSSSSHDFVERLWAVRRVGDLIDQIDMNGQNKELVDELVSLSLKYGLMTPYTSFLADENVPLHASVEHQRRAGLSLERLNEESGQFGVAQRDFKQAYMKADRAPAPAHSEERSAVIVGTQGNGAGGANATQNLPADQPGQQGQAPRGAMGGMGMMGGRGMGEARMPSQMQQYGRVRRNNGPQANSAPVLGKPMIAMAEREQAGSPQAKVRQIGTKTFYFKDGRWVDSSVKPDEDAKAEKLVQFTEDYFRLARSQKAEYNQYLSQEEPVTVKLDGKVYHIDPAPRDVAR
jgi:Ca-activated chloride channel family protein